MLPIHLIPKTTQQAYDIGVRHLLHMTERSANEDGACLYRSPNGNRCVIGSMIPDEEYDSNIDHLDNPTGIDELVFDDDVLLPEEIDLMLLVSLQRIHDDPANWGADGFTNIGVLRTLARDFTISSSIVDAICLSEQVVPS